MSLSSDSGVHQVRFDDGEAITAKAVIIATGARYNRLPLGRLAEFEGVGVYYAATQMEAQACRADPVAIVGGGNSAGQAALFLSRSSADVHLIIRGDTLATSMSRYLIDQIERSSRITVTPRTRVTALLGKDQLEGVELLAGGGVRGGTTYGATDDFGFKAVEKPVHVHDIHATILYLFGIEHTKLTYRYSGRDFRLTDVGGTVLKDLIA